MPRPATRSVQASPVPGNTQRLAVYLNGVRFNHPFADTVNWGLIPDQAIDRTHLIGSNPVFGLNARGGALPVQIKNGFTDHCTELDLLGGSFGKYDGEFQYEGGKRIVSPSMALPAG
jgi:iron complex outermembrane receptor protein